VALRVCAALLPFTARFNWLRMISGIWMNLVEDIPQVLNPNSFWWLYRHDFTAW
jgi:hypothetical protein